MALIHEDGTGLATAESYMSVADADTYFTNHGSPAAWTGATTPAKEAALRFATAWLDGQYAWVGLVKASTQALAWPRIGGYDSEGRAVDDASVPRRIKEAVGEVALAHLGSALNATLARGGAVKREQVGPLAVEYMDWAPDENTLPFVDRLVKGLLASGSASVVMIARA